MRRSTKAAVVAALLVPAVSVTSAVARSGDAATGGGITGIETRMGISAHQGPKGATGHVTLKNFNPGFPGEQQGKVVCIEATGNVATIVYRVTKSDFPEARPGDFRKLRLEDNGNPKAGEPVDRINGEAATSTPQDCSTPLAESGEFLRNGNIRVVDGG